MDDNIEKIVVWGGGFTLAYLFLIRPLVNTFGTSSADQQTVTDQNTVAPADNPFSYNFAPFLGNYGSAIQTAGGMQPYFAAAKYEYDNGQTTLNGTSNDLNIYAEQIESAFGYITYDATTVLGIFNALTAKEDVAYIAGYVFYNYNDDLMTLLTNGRYAPILGLTSGLSKTDLATIINHVNSLPDTNF